MTWQWPITWVQFERKVTRYADTFIQLAELFVVQCYKQVGSIGEATVLQVLGWPRFPPWSSNYLCWQQAIFVLFRKVWVEVDLLICCSTTACLELAWRYGVDIKNIERIVLITLFTILIILCHIEIRWLIYWFCVEIPWLIYWFQIEIPWLIYWFCIEIPWLIYWFQWDNLRGHSLKFSVLQTQWLELSCVSHRHRFKL